MRNDSDTTLTLIDRLLADQAKMSTAVELFSEWHEEQSNVEPAQSKYYQKLIPLSKPQRGEQYSFQVDLDKCTGCKACVVACHSLNGLDEEESWRDIGSLIGTKTDPYLQTVTTACHHCVEPACASGCPVLAYEKDPETGIVRHLDDQCMGCSYCLLKCPYDVPKYHKKKGIVRKCDMCHQRLSEGEAPACVQSCPNEAISIRIVKIDEVRTDSSKSQARLLPSAFESKYTKPTTRYLSRNGIPAFAKSASESTLISEEAHWPLAWMLVLTQLAAGIFGVSVILSLTGVTSSMMNMVALGIHSIGILLSVLHLGQPLRAWKAFLGWRKSWLSREILCFGLLAKLAAVTALWPWLPDDLKVALPSFMNLQGLLVLTASTAFIGVLCSIMVYVDTRRPYWGIIPTTHAFLGTSLILGMGASAVGLVYLGGHEMVLRDLVTLLVGTQVIHGLLGVIMYQKAYLSKNHPWHESVLKLLRLKAGCFRWQGSLYLISTLMWAFTLGDIQGFAPWLSPIAFGLALVSQIFSRHLFFTCVTAPRMPGVLPSTSH